LALSITDASRVPNPIDSRSARHFPSRHELRQILPTLFCGQVDNRRSQLNPFVVKFRTRLAQTTDSVDSKDAGLAADAYDLRHTDSRGEPFNE
jgi:hypothetical protein